MITVSNVEFYEGISKKTGKPYRCLWLTLSSERGSIRVPLFLAPWDWRSLGIDME